MRAAIVRSIIESLMVVGFLAPPAGAEDQLQRIAFNNPDLVVDLGVGLWAWPVPMDVDGDGDHDLAVSCPDQPSNGVWVFENRAGDTRTDKFPVFKPGRRISRGAINVTPSYVDGEVIVSVAASRFPDFSRTGLEQPRKLNLKDNVHPGKIRFNQWRYVDHDGDGNLDLTIGIEDWADYGWDNAFDSAGDWTRGSLHGQIYLLANTGTTAMPRYAEPVKLKAAGKTIDGFGCPSQCFADFDGDGDLDLITGEFLDGFTWYQNTGTRRKPSYAAGRRLPIAMDLEMIVVAAMDWDRDGDVDLIVGQEDGRVALVENTGQLADEVPRFNAPRFFQQEAAEVKFGVLTTPDGIDWDGDGDIDIVSGNSAGYIGFIENLAGPRATPRWAAPRYLEAGGKPIRIMAGPNGSIQGPAEAKWGYTTISAADWDGDGLPDLIVNSIWGKVVWYRNLGTRTSPKLAAAQSIEVEWPGEAPRPAWNWWKPAGKELASQWRTTPFAIDWNRDGLMDLVMLDHEGYLALFPRAKQGGGLKLLPGQRIFSDERGQPLKLAKGEAGKSGRRKFCLADWDGDGRIDLLLDDINVRFYQNVATGGDQVVFKDRGLVDTRVLAGHDTSPTTVDWDGDGVLDLVVGAEDGHFYSMKNPRK